MRIRHAPLWACPRIEFHEMLDLRSSARYSCPWLITPSMNVLITLLLSLVDMVSGELLSSGVPEQHGPYARG